MTQEKGEKEKRGCDRRSDARYHLQVRGIKKETPCGRQGRKKTGAWDVMLEKGKDGFLGEKKGRMKSGKKSIEPTAAAEKEKLLKAMRKEEKRGGRSARRKTRRLAVEEVIRNR